MEIAYASMQLHYIWMSPYVVLIALFAEILVYSTCDC